MPSLPLPLASAFVWLSASLAVVGFSFAQSEPVSPTVGFTRVTLAPGYSAVSVSMLNLDVLTGKVASPHGVTGKVLTATGGAGVNLGASLQATKRYYLEIVAEGTKAQGFVGERFEVDVAGTKALASNKIALQAASPTNTMSPVPDLSDYSFTLREHVTIAQVFGGAGHLVLQGSGSADTSDHLLFYNNAAHGFTTYWLRANAAGTSVAWRSLNGADTADYSNTPILPGVGLLVYRQPAAGPVTLSQAGAVRVNAFRQPLPAGFSLISPPVPLTHSPAAAAMVKSNGWTGSGSATASDQVQLWNGTAFRAYWFRANPAGTVQQWRSIDASDTKDYMNNDTFFQGSKAVLVWKMRADPEYIVDLVK